MKEKANTSKYLNKRHLKNYSHKCNIYIQSSFTAPIKVENWKVFKLKKNASNPMKDIGQVLLLSEGKISFFRFVLNAEKGSHAEI